MSRCRLAVPFLAVLVATLALGPAAAPVKASVAPKPSPGDGLRATDAAGRAGCPATAREIRFDDGRLRIERDERRVNPRAVEERWFSCWRPTGARHLLTSSIKAEGVYDLSVVAVRRGRFAVLGGAGYLQAFDGRTGRHTASVRQIGFVRELLVTARGNLAALQDTGENARQLWAGNGRARCLLDAGASSTPAGGIFGDLALHGEHLEWHNHDVLMGQDLSRLSC